MYSPLSLLFKECILLNKSGLALDTIINCSHLSPDALNDPLNLPDYLLPSSLVFIDPLAELPLLPYHIVYRLLQHSVQP